MDRVGDVLALLDALPADNWTTSVRAPLELPAARAAAELPDDLIPSLGGHLLERITSLGWAWQPESTRGRVERALLSALARRPRRWTADDVELLLGLAARVDPIWRAPDLLDLPLAALERYCADDPIGRLEPLVRLLLERVETSDSRLSTGVRARLRRRLSSVLAARDDAVDVSLFQPTDGWGLAMREWLTRESLPAAPTNAVLMEPNDQHLFMKLPKGPAEEVDGIFMPFEDTLLGHVLAKAFLLANDTRIRDAAIRRQIEAG